jgi:hypothetical protein
VLGGRCRRSAAEEKLSERATSRKILRLLRSADWGDFMRFRNNYFHDRRIIDRRLN